MAYDQSLREKDDGTYAAFAWSMFSTIDSQILEQFNLLRPSMTDIAKPMDEGADHQDNVTMGNMIFDMLNMQFPCVEATPQDRLILADIMQFADHTKTSALDSTLGDNDMTREQGHGFDPICFLKLPVLFEKGNDQRSTTAAHELLSLPLTECTIGTELKTTESPGYENGSMELQNVPFANFHLPAHGCSSREERLVAGAGSDEGNGQTSANSLFETSTIHRTEQTLSASTNTSDKGLDDQQFDYSDALQPAIVTQCSSGLEPVNNKAKRKRTRISKTSVEVESQRMTHIAVERNRRKQMNEHLRVLRSLMPGSYVQRGDQASIIGGAIEFVKELQQLMQCLESQKRRRFYSETSKATSQNSCLVLPPSPLGYFHQQNDKYLNNCFDQLREDIAELKSSVADVEVKLVGYDATIKILSQRRPGQLLHTIAALENMRFTILHTNITTIEHTVLYSFNVKVSVECRSSAEEIAVSVQQIFNMICKAA